MVSLVWITKWLLHKSDSFANPKVFPNNKIIYKYNGTVQWGILLGPARKVSLVMGCPYKGVPL